MRQSLSCLFAVLLLATSTLFAQVVRLGGTISDEFGKGIPFVSVQVGNHIIVMADANGKWSLDAKRPTRLTFSAYGFQSKRIELQSSTSNEINCVLTRSISIRGVEVVVSPNCFVRRELWAVRGRVVDTTGNVLMASISIGTTGGIIADSLGRFHIPRNQLPALIRISHVAYQPVEIQVNSDTNLLVRLTPLSDLKEIVVTSIVCRRRGCPISCGGSRVRRLDLYRQPQVQVPVPIVYPNPTRGMLHFKGVQAVRSLALVDPAGRLLHQWDRPFRASTGSLSLPTVPAGNYMLRFLFDDGRMHTEKILVLR